MLPILHLNGYKIANPTILARISDEELTKFFEGMGYKPHFFVAGFDNESHASIHARFAGLLEEVFSEICDIKASAELGDETRPVYPMIVFRHAQGLDVPQAHRRQEDGGLLARPTHQVPLADARDTHEHFRVLRSWLHSYEPEELFTPEGRFAPR